MPVEKSRLWNRITDALGTEKVSEIQAKLKEIVKTVQAVYKWQDGNPPSLETVVLISDLTGSSIHWLLTGEGTREPIDFTDEEKAALNDVGQHLGKDVSEIIAQFVREKLADLGKIEFDELTVPIYQMYEVLPEQEKIAIANELVRRITAKAS